MSEVKLIYAIVKASQIIDCFSEERRKLSLRDICELTSFSKSTAYGIIRTLEQMNYLIQDPDTKCYRLGLKFVTKGYYASSSLDVLDMAIPVLRYLNDKHNEATTLFLMERNSLRCVYSLGSSGQITSIKTQLGAELGMFSSASGRAILACMGEKELEELLAQKEFKEYISSVKGTPEAYLKQLESIRQKGYSDKDDMESIGFCAISCVIRSQRHPIGTISITGSKILIDEKRDEIIKDLISKSCEISSILG